jgi:peptidoglycan LD-endopeptidase LytH
VVAKTVNFRNGPGEKHNLNERLQQNTFVRVIAQSRDWYRVMLPDQKQGFVFKSMIAPIEKGKKMKLKKPVTLLSSTADDAVPITQVQQPSVEVLARFRNYLYVMTKNGQVGWMLL